MNLKNAVEWYVGANSFARTSGYVRMTVHFLQHKIQEYERLRAEIEELQREAAQKGLMENVYE